LTTHQRQRRWIRALLALVLIVWIASTPGTAAAFGTIDGGGQHREHEHITRAALACAAGENASCFAPRSIDYLAGHDHTFGAVGAPDSDELSDPSAHCDNADFLAGQYAESRDQATGALMDCVKHLRGRFDQGVDAAGGMLDDQGRVIPEEVGLEPECKGNERNENRAKCAALEGFGRALHGVQDFYAHSNWADEADPALPIGDENPPGLDLPAPSPVLDLRRDTTSSIPAGLSTGCFVVRDEVPGVGECASRVTHAALNKDRGLINADTGEAIDPTTPRGMVEGNFAKAVAGARTETYHQWQDFQSELDARYGTERGELMACALTHDDPVNDCRGGGWGRVVDIAVVVALVVAAGVAVVLLVRHRSRRTSQHS
jgi:hypothetical protein